MRVRKKGKSLAVTLGSTVGLFLIVFVLKHSKMLKIPSKQSLEQEAERLEKFREEGVTEGGLTHLNLNEVPEDGNQLDSFPNFLDDLYQLGNLKTDSIRLASKSSFDITKQKPFQFVSKDACSEYLFNDRAQCCSDGSKPVMGGLDFVQMSKDITDGVSLSWGTPKYSSTLHSDAGDFTFYFASKTNLHEFLDDPWKYTPLFGGYAVDQLADDDFTMNSPETLGPYSNLPSIVYIKGRPVFFSGLTSTDVATVITTVMRAHQSWKQLFETDQGYFNTQCFRWSHEGRPGGKVLPTVPTVEVDLAQGGALSLALPTVQIDIESLAP